MKYVNRADAFFLGWIVGMLVIFVIDSFLPSYRDGQIDALTGNAKVKLVTHADSTRTWENIK